jgi:UDP-N-acetylmuramyl pentapeptide synthase
LILLLGGINNTTIFDSSYNSDPDSVFAMLKSLELKVKSDLQKEKNSKTEALDNDLSDYFKAPSNYLVLGEMRELGSISTDKHKQVLDKLLELKAGYEEKIEDIILVGSEWLECDFDKVSKFQDDYQLIVYKNVNFRVFSQAGRVYDYLKDNVRPGSWFWIKGSQNTIFLEILVENLLSNKDDLKLVCRQEPRWFEMRKPFE